MPITITAVRTLAALAAAGLVAGCGVVSGPVAASASAPARTTATTARTPTTTSAIDRLTTQARRRYADEVRGGVVHTQLRRVAADRLLLRALQSGDPAALRGYVTRQFRTVWYHRHISRLRIARGSQTLVEVGVPFVVAPSSTMLRDAHGRALATLQISVQDEIGFVRYMHRNFPVDVVVRGSGPGHVKTSLPAAANVRLPARGTVQIAGRRMAVRSFHETAMGGEPVTVWILARA